MSFDKAIHRIAIVGTGVIGASWAAQYLARGFDVIATDPAPNAEANLRQYIDEAWPALTSVGLSPGASRDRLSFTANMKEALELHFEGMVEDGDPIPKPGGVDSYREVMKELDLDQYFLAHVQIDTSRFAAPVSHA